MSKGNFLEGLYDMAGVKQEDGMSKFDEQKLRRELEGNKKLMGRNKDIFREAEPRFSTCPSYNPCCICDKCQNKASHLYVKCQICLIPICTHTNLNRQTMIRRKNFQIHVSKKTFEKIKNLAVKALER